MQFDEGKLKPTLHDVYSKAWYASWIHNCEHGCCLTAYSKISEEDALAMLNKAIETSVPPCQENPCKP